MAQVKIRPEKGARLDQLDLQLNDKQNAALNELEKVSRYERAILRILQRNSGGVRYRNGMTAQELQRATKLSMSTVTARLSELGAGAGGKSGKGLITVTGYKKEKSVKDGPEGKREKIKLSYVYDLSDKGLLFVESLP